MTSVIKINYANQWEKHFTMRKCVSNVILKIKLKPGNS